MKLTAPTARFAWRCCLAASTLLAASGTPAAPSAVRPNDPTISTAFRQINVQAAWAKTKGDCTGAIVALIGNGVDIDHPDLKQNIISIPGGDGELDDVHGWNFEANDSDPRPDGPDKARYWWHETFAAGIIGAVGDNGIGTTGICERARILPIRKVFADDSDPEAAHQAAESIYYAVEVRRRESARAGHDVPMVISGSWGMDIGAAHASPVLRRAIDAAARAGLGMVFAAGNYQSSNDAPRTAVYPASWSVSNPNVVSVGAVDENDRLSSLSNHGDSVLITAPAVGLYSTVPGGGYAWDVAGREGYTSWAAPQVAAAIAMYWSLHPDAPFSVVKRALLSSADHIPGLKVLGGNRLNVGRMVNGP